MFEQTFKNIDDVLYKDSAADSELDYIEQTSLVLFLRYLTTESKTYSSDNRTAKSKRARTTRTEKSNQNKIG
jgi:hypothetical protein